MSVFNYYISDWFERGTAWFLASGMINPKTGLVDDRTHDSNLNADGFQFKGIFMRYLGLLYEITGTRLTARFPA